MKKITCGGLLLGLILLVLPALACVHVDDEGETPIPKMDEYVAPTETERGYYPPMVCPVCFEEIESGYILYSLREQECQNRVKSGEGHVSPVSDPGISETCLTSGLSAGSHCDYCGAIIEVQRPIPAKGHAWGKPEYTWAADYSQATASRICANDSEHKEEETVKTSSVTTPATYEAPGSIVYTAVFKNPAFSVQTATEVIPQLVEITGPYTDTTGCFDISTNGTATYTGPVNNSAAVTIPDTVAVNGKQIPVTAVAEKAFYKNQKLKTVTIGRNVQTIGAKAFASCTKLKAVKGGASVRTIKNSAFSGCRVLKTLPAFGKLKTIETGAFKGCAKMENITLGTAVIAIGKNAFNGCKALKKIIVKTKKLTKKNVGAGAFKNISEKAAFKCPKGKRKAYQELFIEKGAPKTSVFK